jgi:hypothetical protein
MIARDNAIIACTPAADYTGMEGYFVKATGTGDTVTLCTGVTDSPLGVITEGADTTGKVSVAILGGGLAGTVKVKLSGTPGNVVFGSLLELHTTDGTVALADGGSETVVARALEAGAANELIEAVLLSTAGTVTIDKTFLTTCVSTASGAVMTTTGQVTDASGNALSGYFIVGLCYSEAANTAIPYDFGNPAAKANSVILTEHVADAYIEVRTHSDGSWGVDNTFTADDVGHVAAWVVGKTAASTVSVDVP